MAEDNLEQSEATNANGSPLGDIVGGIGFLIFAVLMFIGAVQFPWKLNHMRFMTAPGFTPILLSTLIFVLAIILIVTTWRRAAAGSLNVKVWIKAIAGDETFRRFGVLVLISGAYIFLVGVVNFILLTFLFLVGIYAYLRIGKIPRVLIYSIINAALIAYFVPMLFQMPRP